MKDNNHLQTRDNNNSNTHLNKYHQQQGGHNDRRNKHQQNQPHHQQHHQHQQQQQHHQQQQQQQQQFHHQRDRSGQRNQGGQHPDSSMGRDNSIHVINHSNLGSIRFQPGLPTRELPPIETKADPNKKFTGRCRLFVGNLPHNTTEDKLRSLFESYGEVGEVYLGPKSAFAFIKMDTRQTAEAARDALDCSTYEGRTLRVRLAAHAAAIRIKHLSPQVTNELLAYAFRYFGEIERAVVVVDDKGKSIGEGVVEYSKKQSALYAIKRCQQECFMLTASPKPVLVEPFDQQDEDEGLPEKSINKNTTEFKEQREVGPRFAEQGSFEQTFALRWKELYEVEKQKRERLEQEIQEARKNLQDQIEYSRLEHDTMQLRSRLQQLEDDRLKLQQMKEQTLNSAQQRDEQRRQQDMLIRQREEDILRRQQLGDFNGLNQQETALRMQANALQDILSNQERSHGGNEDSVNDSSQSQSQHKSSGQAGSQANADVESIPISHPQMNLMGPPPIPNQPMAARSFADAAMMALNPQSQPFIPVSQQQMGMPPPNQSHQPNMYTAFMPQQHQQMRMQQMPISGSDGQNYGLQQSSYNMVSQVQALNTGSGGGVRPKYNRQYNGNNKGTSSNNVVLTTGGRSRKRGKFSS